MFNEKLLDILACPVCKVGVEYDRENQKLICTKCGRRYRIEDGIPIMLIEEAELPEED
ncbi:MAG: Trm112 family protein [Candidatus Coatesbacteria bacterium]|nr:MAG: Trm112 family protein [Candidatus Coatesbacteria bacterium]RLC41760.1 MAG: Trm112 family protein [Candidatus Coatesbacteria bacterium]RLC43072.1 MAG: Trm112 family protein [Candidatus Coatesbacteria bacterium]HEC80283.1 Trm112 family protein [Bacillota bacterium]